MPSKGADGRIKIDAQIIHGAQDGWLKPGDGKTEWFKDYECGPDMVVVPAGIGVVGSPETEPQREGWRKGTESPQHNITIARPFAAGRHAVTRGQFAAFMDSTGHEIEPGATFWNGANWEAAPSLSWLTPGFVQDDDHPVVCINWHDAQAYVAWLSDQTAKPYQLLTEAHREYLARAGTTTPFWWGTSITSEQANYDGNHTYDGGSKGESRKATVPVGCFGPNPWGFFNVHGNVWEWCRDVWHDNYSGAPTDGTAWLQGADDTQRVVRGGSWLNYPTCIRSAYRRRLSMIYRSNFLGFRVSRTVRP